MSAYTIDTVVHKMHLLQDQVEGTKLVRVFIRLIFLRVGELNTQAEKFHAHVAIEARWFLQSEDEKEKILSSLSLDDQNRLDDGNTVKLEKDFADNNWYPQLFLLNVSRDHDEDIRYSIKKFGSRIQIREFRDVHGQFYSKFDLHHFPTDIQELSVSIGSALFDTEILLEADPDRASGINREAFVDQQEWKLYDHIETRTKFIKGFLFQNDDDYELDTPGHQRKRAILTVACHAARRAKYFYWNGYCLIFLITVIAFSSFAIPPDAALSRVGITCTLLLTSIAFRWTISNYLPNISYLTVIDIYSLVSLFSLIVLCAWHSVMGRLVFIYGGSEKLKPDSHWVSIDRNVFYGFACLYTIAHFAVGIWHYYVPIARRRHMERLDKLYREIIHKNISKDRSSNRSSTNYSHNIDSMV